MTKAGTTLVAADAPAPTAPLPRRRGIELALIVVAVLLSVYGYCAVGLAKNGTVRPAPPATAPDWAYSRWSRIWPYACAPPARTRCCCRSGCCSTASAWS